MFQKQSEISMALAYGAVQGVKGPDHVMDLHRCPAFSKKQTSTIEEKLILKNTTNPSGHSSEIG